MSAVKNVFVLFLGLCLFFKLPLPEDNRLMWLTQSLVQSCRSKYPMGS